jgi:serine protease Do
MEDILLLEAIERYLANDMSAEEKAYFEQLRKSTPEIDQMVVEHNMFTHQMEDYAANRNLKHSLHLAHAKLLSNGAINEGGELTTKGKVVKMWNKYRRVTAIAAAVGGGIALMISGLVTYYAPANTSKLEELGTKVKVLEGRLNEEIKKGADKLPKDVTTTSNGTSFLVDGKGYLVTNAHVVKGSSSAIVVNNKGEAFKAHIAFRDELKDLAILKIEDEDFETIKILPYGIRKNKADLGEEIFTLGYPRNSIVYNQGFLSSETGFNGDSLSFQIQMSANPGNSGGPVLNKNGEVIGVLSTREKLAEGVTFAITGKSIYHMMEEVRKTDTTVQKIKMPSYTTLKGMDRVSQIKQIEACVFLVKAYK